MFSRWKNNTRAAALDQLWDHLQAADGSRPPGASERPDDVEAIETVLKHDDAPAIDPVFSAILLKDLTNMHAQQQFEIRPNGYGTLAVTAKRWPAISSDSPFRERHGWGGTPRFRLAAGLAVVVILLAIGALAVRPQPSSEPPAIPAAVVQDQSQVESRTLMDISFPAGRMRGDDGAQLIFGESRVLPGNQLVFHISCDSLDSHPFYVLEGTLSAEVAGTSYLLPAGSSEWKTIQAGETAEVTVGDTWYYENLTPDGMTNLRNSGTGDLRYIWAGVRQNSSKCQQSAPSGEDSFWAYVEDPSGPIDPTQPVRLVLRTVTMPVGSSMEGEIGGLPIPTAEQDAMGARQWVKILSGSPSLMIEKDASEGPVAERWPKYLVITQDVTRTDENKRVTIANESEEPVELMVLDIVVGDPGAQGGIAAPPAASAAASS